eukprot:9467168-Pyramimonas_sp.AAC.1
MGSCDGNRCRRDSDETVWVGTLARMARMSYCGREGLLARGAVLVGCDLWGAGDRVVDWEQTKL